MPHTQTHLHALDGCQQMRIVPGHGQHQVVRLREAKRSALVDWQDVVLRGCVCAAVSARLSASALADVIRVARLTVSWPPAATLPIFFRGTGRRPSALCVTVSFFPSAAQRAGVQLWPPAQRSSCNSLTSAAFLSLCFIREVCLVVVST